MNLIYLGLPKVAALRAREVGDEAEALGDMLPSAVSIEQTTR